MTKKILTKGSQPFLRWTGSKRWLIKDHINELLPARFNNYHEPFLGGGAVFFYVKELYKLSNKQFYLSDTNTELINCYHNVQINLPELLRKLSTFSNSEKDYYQIRENVPTDLLEQAARFIYLNRTSFNGIYRVNSRGLYNVPYGHRPHVDVIAEEIMLSAQDALRGATIFESAFKDTLPNIQEGDLVFIDPPYTVAHENNGFIEYNQHLFTWRDQVILREYVSQIAARNAFFIVTNASHDSILQLYEGAGRAVRMSRRSQVGGRNKTRGVFNELVIFNTR